MIQAAGWPAWFLLIASVVALALVIERALALRAARICPPGLLDQVLGQHRQGRLTPQAIEQLSVGSPLGRVLAAGLRPGPAPRMRLRESVEDAGRLVAHELERRLGALATVASTAPLLGLLGTVVGMIEIFAAQAPGGGDPRQLAQGISVALYNTAFGLLVAIPALVAWRWFRGRVDDLLNEMAEQGGRLVDRLTEGRP